MGTSMIVSYDGTPNDDDALALAASLARAGGTLALAYVRHSREFDSRREELAQHDAERRLAQGAVWLGDASISQHVVVSASTGEGLAQLAASQGASLIMFGSDYRTPPGTVEPGTTAQYLLEGGSVAVGVAAAGLRSTADLAIESIAVYAANEDTAARDTADALAEKIGATIVTTEQGSIDLIIVGSQSSAPVGRVLLSGSTRSQLSAMRSSVLVVPHGQPVLF